MELAVEPFRRARRGGSEGLFYARLGLLVEVTGNRGEIVPRLGRGEPAAGLLLIAGLMFRIVEQVLAVAADQGVPQHRQRHRRTVPRSR